MLNLFSIYLLFGFCILAAIWLTAKLAVSKNLPDGVIDQPSNPGSLSTAPAAVKRSPLAIFLASSILAAVVIGTMLLTLKYMLGHSQSNLVPSGIVAVMIYCLAFDMGHINWPESDRRNSLVSIILGILAGYYLIESDSWLFFDLGTLTVVSFVLVALRRLTLKHIIPIVAVGTVTEMLYMNRFPDRAVAATDALPSLLGSLIIPGAFSFTDHGLVTISVLDIIVCGFLLLIAYRQDQKLIIKRLFRYTAFGFLVGLGAYILAVVRFQVPQPGLIYLVLCSYLGFSFAAFRSGVLDDVLEF